MLCSRSPTKVKGQAEWIVEVQQKLEQLCNGDLTKRLKDSETRLDVDHFIKGSDHLQVPFKYKCSCVCILSMEQITGCTMPCNFDCTCSIYKQLQKQNIFVAYIHNLAIDLFTNVSQIYGCYFPRDLVMSHFIYLLYLTGISVLGIHFAYIGCCYFRQTSDKLSGCQEQPLYNWYAYN